MPGDRDGCEPPAGERQGCRYGEGGGLSGPDSAGSGRPCATWPTAEAGPDQRLIPEPMTVAVQQPRFVTDTVWFALRVVEIRSPNTSVL